MNPITSIKFDDLENDFTSTVSPEFPSSPGRTFSLACSNHQNSKLLTTTNIPRDFFSRARNEVCFLHSKSLNWNLSRHKRERISFGSPSVATDLQRATFKTGSMCPTRQPQFALVIYWHAFQQMTWLSFFPCSQCPLAVHAARKITPRKKHPSALSLHPTISHVQYILACVSPVTLLSPLLQCDGGPRFPGFREQQHIVRCFKPWAENSTTPLELGKPHHLYVHLAWRKISCHGRLSRMVLKCPASEHEHTEGIMRKNKFLSLTRATLCTSSSLSSLPCKQQTINFPSFQRKHTFFWIFNYIFLRSTDTKKWNSTFTVMYQTHSPHGTTLASTLSLAH